LSTCLVSTKVPPNVKRLGETPESVVIRAVLDRYRGRSRRKPGWFDPFAKYGGVGPNKFDLSKGYPVVMQHPVTTERGSAASGQRSTP
jgi:hypothetical protein